MKETLNKDCEKQINKTFWIVFIGAIAIIVIFFTLMFCKLFSVEERLKDYIYQNEDIRTNILSELDDIKEQLDNLSNKTLTIK